MSSEHPESIGLDSVHNAQRDIMQEVTAPTLKMQPHNNLKRVAAGKMIAY